MFGYIEEEYEHMKIIKVFIIGFLLLLAACGSEEVSNKKTTFEFSVEDLENRIKEALKQMGSETNLKMISNEINEDGEYVITLSDKIYFFIQVDDSKNVTKVTLAALSDAFLSEKNDLMFSFLLLVGTVDDSLVAGERSKVVSNLRLNDNTVNILDHLEVFTFNEIEYTYKGSSEDHIILQAIPK
jgi:hypothetical protein